MPRVQQRRGLKVNLPTSNMVAGELFLTTDFDQLYYAKDATTKKPVVPDVEALDTLAAVTGTEDLIMLIDASEASAAKAKKMTFNNFKTALNIPAASTDEKVAIVSGGTAGYLYGTDGTDGVVRVNASMSMTKDASNNFMTFGVEIIDCGTF